MAYRGFHEDDEVQSNPPSRRRSGSAGGGRAPSADETGGRSTGVFTGFGGGRFGSGGGGGAGGGGAVVKANYRRAGNPKAVKASARYYTTRENEHGEKREREAFSRDRDELSRGELNERLERADQEHRYHYRMAVSPGTNREAEGVDLKDYTRQVMQEVERQQRGQVSWVAVEHARDSAHTGRAHVHVITSTDRMLTREDLERLRDHATRSWEEAREHARTLERDPTIERDMKELSRLREQGERVREPVSRDVQERPGRSLERQPERGAERHPERDGGRER